MIATAQVLYKVGEDAISDAFARAADASDSAQAVLGQIRSLALASLEVKAARTTSQKWQTCGRLANKSHQGLEAVFWRLVEHLWPAIGFDSVLSFSGQLVGSCNMGAGTFPSTCGVQCPSASGTKFSARDSWL